MQGERKGAAVKIGSGDRRIKTILGTATREVVGRFLVGSWSVFAEYLQSQFLDIILYFSYTILRNTFSEGVTYGPPTTVNSAGGVSFRKSDVQSPAVF